MQSHPIHTNDLFKPFKDFEATLSKIGPRYRKAIKNKWEGNEQLRNWYSGKPVSFNNEIEPHIITLEELIPPFNFALHGIRLDIITAIWKNNPKLRDWYSSKRVVMEDGVEYSISLTDLISHFKFALHSRNISIIKAMWEGNPRLRDWYCGMLVLFDNETESRVICQKDLIFYFMLALSSQVSYLVKAIWDDSIRLQTMTKNLINKEAILILKKVLMMIDRGSSIDFVTKYINRINNPIVIDSVLTDIKEGIQKKSKNKNSIRVTNIKIRLLEDHLKFLKMNVSSLYTSSHGPQFFADNGLLKPKRKLSDETPIPQFFKHLRTNETTDSDTVTETSSPFSFFSSPTSPIPAIVISPDFNAEPFNFEDNKDIERMTIFSF